MKKEILTEERPIKKDCMMPSVYQQIRNENQDQKLEK